MEDKKRFGKKTKNLSQFGPAVWPVIANIPQKSKLFDQLKFKDLSSHITYFKKNYKHFFAIIFLLKKYST